MEKSIYDCIEDAQQGNKSDMLYLIEKFQPLIKKHSYHLKYDDAIGDVTLAFIEVIHKIKLIGFDKGCNDYTLLCYIKRSLQNTFLRLSIKMACNNANVEFSEDVNYPSQNDKLAFDFEVSHALSRLTKLQREVILLKYYYGYTDEEIGVAFSISRQAVNRIKNRALKFLESELDNK